EHPVPEGDLCTPLDRRRHFAAGTVLAVRVLGPDKDPVLPEEDLDLLWGDAGQLRSEHDPVPDPVQLDLRLGGIPSREEGGSARRPRNHDLHPDDKRPAVPGLLHDLPDQFLEMFLVEGYPVHRNYAVSFTFPESSSVLCLISFQSLLRAKTRARSFWVSSRCSFRSSAIRTAPMAASRISF